LGDDHDGQDRVNNLQVLLGPLALPSCLRWKVSGKLLAASCRCLSRGSQSRGTWYIHRHPNSTGGSTAWLTSASFRHVPSSDLDVDPLPQAVPNPAHRPTDPPHRHVNYLHSQMLAVTKHFNEPGQGERDSSWHHEDATRHSNWRSNHRLKRRRLAASKIPGCLTGRVVIFLLGAA
jgi:hypothetical protein